MQQRSTTSGPRSLSTTPPPTQAVVPRMPQPPAVHRTSHHVSPRSAQLQNANSPVAPSCPRAVTDTTATNAQKRAYHVNTTSAPLGSGAFGTVYEGYEKTTKQPVAVKLTVKRKLTEKDIEATRREATMMRKLGSHPNLLSVLDSSEDPKYMFTVTPIVSGGCLHTAVTRGGYSDDGARELLRNLLTGIAHMHEHGVMHRDIKLENVLLHPREARGPLAPDADMSTNPVLIDFGFATDEAHTATFCGTPYYLAPEVIAAARDKTKQTTYDKKCDVWSFGVLAFIVLNDGAKPFVARTMRECFDVILRNRPAWTDFCSSAARAFVESVLINDPAKRPSAAELLQHPWLRDDSVSFASWDMPSMAPTEPFGMMDESAASTTAFPSSPRNTSTSTACYSAMTASEENGECGAPSSVSPPIATRLATQPDRR